MDLLSVSTLHLCFSLFAAKDSRNDCSAKIDYPRCGATVVKSYLYICLFREP